MSLFYSRKNNGVRKYGVFIIVYECFLQQVKSVEPVNDRIYYVILKGKYIYVGVISCYGPIEEK